MMWPATPEQIQQMLPTVWHRIGAVTLILGVTSGVIAWITHPLW